MMSERAAMLVKCVLIPSSLCSVSYWRCAMRFRLVVICAAVFAAVILSASRVSAQGFCFNAAISYAAGDGPSSVFAADLDGDGDQDLAVANAFSNNVSVLKNNGDGTYAAAVNYAAGDGPVSTFATDLDGDGDQELMGANYM